MPYYNLIKLAEASRPKSKAEALREKFNDRILYPFASVAGFGGLGAVAGHSSGKNATSRAVDKAEREANTIINNPGGLNDERARLEDVVRQNQQKIDDNASKFKSRLDALHSQAQDIIDGKNKTHKPVNLDDIAQLINEIADETKKPITERAGLRLSDYEDLKKSKDDLLAHEQKIREFREGKIRDARKILKNSPVLRTLAGGVGAGTLGYGAYNMYRNMRDKD